MKTRPRMGRGAVIATTENRVDLRYAAQQYLQSGWFAIPTITDSQGNPERPAVAGWSDPDFKKNHDLEDLPWEDAAGVALILGPVSGGLGVICIDDPELAQEALGVCSSTRCVRAPQGGVHIYIIEQVPSPPRRVIAEWRGRRVVVELRTTGKLVVAPPTPGYQLVSDVLPTKKWVDIPSAWWGLAKRLGILEVTEGRYPKPWREFVPEGERNCNAYIEASCLRDAKAPLLVALRLMRARWESDYQKGGQTWDEIERTVRSAYGRPSLAGGLA